MQRRHRRHLTEWQSLIAEFAAGDFSVDQFCQRHDLSPENFRRWHSRLAGDDGGASGRSKTTRLVPVLAAAAAPDTPAPAMVLHHGPIQLALPADTPATRVADLIKAISHA